MQGYRYPNPLNNRRSSTGISQTLQDFLLPIYTEEKVEKIGYKISYFLETARTLCDLGFFAKYRHLSDDALMLEIICMSVDCDAGDRDLDYPDTLFLEGSYRQILELDTERILGCLSFEDWKEILYWNNKPEPDLEILNIDDFDDEDILDDDTYWDEDYEETLEENALIEEDSQKPPEEETLCDRPKQKSLEYRFDTLLESLGKLSKISRGKFIPENIVEVENNCIQFDLEGKTHCLALNDLPYEPSILAIQINPIISEIGYQFELLSGRDIKCRYDGYEVYVTLLSEEEREKLAQDTDGLFDDLLMFPHQYLEFDAFYGDGGLSYNFERLLGTLVDLFRLFRGKFILQNIVEIDKRLIQIELNGKLGSLRTWGSEDDLFILAAQINPMILDTGYQFEFCYYDWGEYNDAFLILLSEQEKQKLKDKYKWDFHNCFETFSGWADFL
ncbi:hypothetical protein [Roseofilum casamattae]|uniref:Uncharacterized protein n=1 Tax=Roseofilum casamattae BLCC-M143 TaxID=3022442 RepID=A0ABT7BZV7_9CYAN|nr:hypothetical protein [Roseofilum casamattae]MDJ1184743.1 hypothetical protein [Roseofilum casamattae BLCC-M143]